MEINSTTLQSLLTEKEQLWRGKQLPFSKPITWHIIKDLRLEENFVRSVPYRYLEIAKLIICILNRYCVIRSRRCYFYSTVETNRFVHWKCYSSLVNIYLSVLDVQKKSLEYSDNQVNFLKVNNHLYKLNDLKLIGRFKLFHGGPNFFSFLYSSFRTFC